MWNPLNKSKDEKGSSVANAKIHVDQPLAVSTFANQMNLYLSLLYRPTQELVILCIGTDRSTGDSLGPLTGSKLIERGINPDMVYGTLDKPVHAVNLQETIQVISRKYRDPFVIAIDACLGRSETVGFISIKEGPLQPGTGVNKDLPPVGDLQVIGIVNVGGFMEYMVLQNTRLNLVMKMADIISRGLSQCIEKPLLYPASETAIRSMESLSQ